MRIESHLFRFTLAVLIITVVIEFIYEFITEAYKTIPFIYSVGIWLVFLFISVLMIALMIFVVFNILPHRTETQNKSHKRIINPDDFYFASVLILSTFAIRKASEVLGGVLEGYVFYIAVLVVVAPIFFVVNRLYSLVIHLIPPYHQNSI